MEQCRVIAITNQKGGVGKTTTTVNLGVGLAKQGKRVLLIDADPQGSLTISLGERNPDQLSETLSDVMECVINDKSLPENFGLLRSTEGVDLIPANIELSGTEVGLFNVMSREYVLKSYIDSVSKNYDYILIDCMPSLGMMTINALAAADRVIIPSQPSFLSTKGLNQLMHLVAKVKRQINPHLNIDGILLMSSMSCLKTSSARPFSIRHGGSFEREMRTRPLSHRMWSICWIPFRQVPCSLTRSLLSCSIRQHPTVKSWRTC